MQNDFKQDLLKILQRLYNGDNEGRDIYLCITDITLGVYKADDISKLRDTLGVWYDIFKCMIEERFKGFLNMRGYYGYLLSVSLSPGGVLINPRHDVTYPVPSYFGTINLSQGMVERMNENERKIADNISEGCLSSEHIDDWTKYDPYCYFYRKTVTKQLNEVSMDDIVVKMSESESPYLKFFRCIGSAVSQVSSLDSVHEI